MVADTGITVVTAVVVKNAAVESVAGVAVGSNDGSVEGSGTEVDGDGDGATAITDPAVDTVDAIVVTIVVGDDGCEASRNPRAGVVANVAAAAAVVVVVGTAPSVTIKAVDTPEIVVRSNGSAVAGLGVAKDDAAPDSTALVATN